MPTYRAVQARHWPFSERPRSRQSSSTTPRASTAAVPARLSQLLAASCGVRERGQQTTAPGRAVQAQEAGPGLVGGFGQKQHIALAGPGFAPGGGLGQGVGVRRVEHGVCRYGGAQVQQQGGRAQPLRQGGKGKA